MNRFDTGIDSPYVAEKDYRNLYASFQIHFGPRFLDVFVWKSVRGLYRNTGWKKKVYQGAYIGYPYGKRQRGLFGEIHLLKGWIGAGYVVHEISHFGIDWLTNHPLDKPDAIARLNEPYAWLIGEVMKAFYNEWYKIEKRHK